MSIAALLERAKRELAAPAAQTELPVAARSELATGDAVVVEHSGVTRRGAFAFLEDGWTYWADDDGVVRATKQEFVRRS